MDGEGNVIIAEYHNHRVRKILTSGTVSTLAGSGAAGFADGAGAAAQFNCPWGVAVDGEGNVIVTDYHNHRVRKISTSGTVSTLAGSGTSGSVDGAGTAAQFNYPRGIVVDGEGNIIVADYYTNRVRKISASGTVSTLAGSGTAGFADGAGAAAQFNHPWGVAVDGEGNVIVADCYNHRVRKISTSGTVSTLAGYGTAGFADGAGAAVHFNSPCKVAVDGEGNVFIAEYSNHCVRKISTSGTFNTLAGSRTAGFAAGAGAAAQFDSPLRLLWMVRAMSLLQTTTSFHVWTATSLEIIPSLLTTTVRTTASCFRI